MSREGRRETTGDKRKKRQNFFGRRTQGARNRAMDKSGQNVPVARSEGHRFPEMNEAGFALVAKRGETAAFTLLYRAYAGKILRTVHRITRNHETLKMRSMTLSLEHSSTFKRSTVDQAFSTWLTRIGINSALIAASQRSAIHAKLHQRNTTKANRSGKRRTRAKSGAWNTRNKND